jgi:hypothetical protein
LYELSVTSGILEKIVGHFYLFEKNFRRELLYSVGFLKMHRADQTIFGMIHNMLPMHTFNLTISTSAHTLGVVIVKNAKRRQRNREHDKQHRCK